MAREILSKRNFFDFYETINNLFVDIHIKNTITMTTVKGRLFWKTEVEDKMLALSGNLYGSCSRPSLPLQLNNISGFAATLSKFSYSEFSLSS
jgi:hypothetical protein